MLKTTTLFFLLMICVTVKGQNLSFAYDASGNRVERSIILRSTENASAQVSQPTTSYVEEILSERQIRLYPNPVEEVLTINILGFDTHTQGEFILYDLSGKMLAKQYIEGESSHFNMNRYPKGNYVLKIILNEQESVWKIIKK